MCVTVCYYFYVNGVSFAVQICNEAGVPHDKEVKSLNDSMTIALRNTIEKKYKVEGDLRREVSLNIKKKKDIKCYQGMRHIRKLPVRGQNTHSNARTRKGKAVAIAGKKKVTK